ncbi:MAG TPA: marine proteobacterial sortase target protein [Terriglobales bacterium]|nr:marine proteobacterial sortase target protein [Terriglobales bacterium]
MARHAVVWFKNTVCPTLLLLILISTIVLGNCSAAAQDDNTNKANRALPQLGEGCLLYRSPVAGRYEAVPLTHTDVALDVRGLVASATVTQQYSNSTSQPIEAIYVFPLPHDAAVYDMEIHIGNRIIRSVIKERAEAKKIYEAAKTEGKRTALVEEERPNIFTTSVANIMPGDQISVRLRYVEPLRWEDGKMRLVFPMVVGPRYIPGTQAVGHEGTGWASDTNAVPDASRITPPVRHPESRSGHDISLAVDLDSGFEAADVKSISHTIHVNRLSDGRQHIELSTGATLPNKDFVLEVEQAESSRPKTVLFLSPSDSGETHFLLATFPPTVQPKERMPVEMLYMIDVSGSMSGTSIEQAREALLQALDKLKPTDRFGILQFQSDYREFSPEPLQATPENLDTARRYVRSLEANGGTEMLPALRHLMRKPVTPGYLRHIILLTDGDLGNEEEIFSAMRSELGNARLFTVAIGSAPNLFLATKMAQFGRGTFTHIADVSEVRDQMTHLFDSIDSPVLTDVKLTFTGVEVSDVYPERVPDLFLRQPLLVYGRITKGSTGTVHLTASAGNDPYEASIPFDASKATFHPGITTIWARQRVEDLMDHWRHSDEKGQAEIRGSVIAHAIRYNLVTRFTSLVAVEEVVVNKGGQNNSVAVPTEMPAGWQMDKVFGAPATGTTDEFFETLGITLLVTGIGLWLLSRKQRLAAVSARTRL